MSGGSLNYFYSELESHDRDFGDLELNELVKDLAQLFHDREWYLSGDICEGRWNEARDDFKQKWFTDIGRQQRVEQAFDNAKTELLQSFGFDTKYCKDCKHWIAEPKSQSGYGNCEFTSCYLHRCETCEKWEKR